MVNWGDLDWLRSKTNILRMHIYPSILPQKYKVPIYQILTMTLIKNEIDVSIFYFLEI